MKKLLLAALCCLHIDLSKAAWVPQLRSIGLSIAHSMPSAQQSLRHLQTRHLKGCEVLGKYSPTIGALLTTTCDNDSSSFLNLWYDYPHTPSHALTNLFFYKNPVDRTLNITDYNKGIMKSLPPQVFGDLFKTIETKTPLTPEQKVNALACWHDSYKEQAAFINEPFNEKKFKKRASETLDTLQTLALAQSSDEASLVLLAAFYKVAQTKSDVVTLARQFNISLTEESFNPHDTFSKESLITGPLSARIAKALHTFCLTGYPSYLEAPQLQLPYKKLYPRPFCVEEAIRTLVNWLLYNPETHLLDFSLLSPEVQKQCQLHNPAFYTFIESYRDCSGMRYYANSASEWLELLSELPGIDYCSKVFEIQSGPQVLKVLEHLFGLSTISSFKKLGEQLSTPTRTVLLDDHSWKTNVTITTCGQPRTIGTVVFERGHAKAKSSKAETPSVGEWQILENGECNNLSYHVLNEDQKIALIKSLSPVEINKQKLLIKECMYYDSLKVLKTLLEAGADLGVTDKDNNTALHRAVREGRSPETVQFLLQAGADTTGLNYLKCTPLMMGLVCKSPLVIINLLLQGDAQRGSLGYQATTSSGQNALHVALENDSSLEIIEALLKAGVSISHKDNEGFTPLHTAVSRNRSPEIIALLLNHSASITATDTQGNTALLTALPRLNLTATPDDTLTILKLLINAGSDIHHANARGETLLHRALSGRYSIDVIRYLIEGGASVDSCDDNQETPLHMALATKKSYEITHLLIHSGASVTTHNKQGLTPLHIALRSYCTTEVLSLLIESGADVDAQDVFYGNTPLHTAIVPGQPTKIIELLLNAGADPHRKNKRNETPLDSALDLNQSDEVINLLRGKNSLTKARLLAALREKAYALKDVWNALR